MFKPDTPKATYVVLDPPTKNAPKIIFGTTALKWISALVDLHPQEVGFYAIVDERPNYTFFIRDVFYPKHSEANAGTCEISPEGETDMMNWLIEHGREGDLEKQRFWGHSHHTMGTSPSAQDEKQSLERMNNTHSFFIRAICNKAKEMSVSFFDFANKVRFDHIKWKVEDDYVEKSDEERVSLINETLTQEGLSASDMINNIKNIIDDDYIEKKIKELKEVNLPKATITHYPPYNNHQQSYNEYNPPYDYNTRFSLGKKKNLNQQTLFDTSQGNMPGNRSIANNTNSKSEQDELEAGFTRNMGYPFPYPDDYDDDDDTKQDIINQEELENAMKNWEENQGIGG